MLDNSVLTNKMDIKGSIGGMKFGEANSIYYSDSQHANLLRNCEFQNSTFHFKNVPSREDMELVPRSANVSQTLAARITNHLSCSSIMDKLTRRRDDDYDPGSGVPGASNYIQHSLSSQLMSRQMFSQNK